MRQDKIAVMEAKATALLEKVFSERDFSKLYQLFAAETDDNELFRQIKSHVEGVAGRDFPKEIVEGVVTLVIWGHIAVGDASCCPQDYYLGRLNQVANEGIYGDLKNLKRQLKRHNLAVPVWYE